MPVHYRIAREDDPQVQNLFFACLPKLMLTDYDEGT